MPSLRLFHTGPYARVSFQIAQSKRDFKVSAMLLIIEKMSCKLTLTSIYSPVEYFSI